MRTTLLACLLTLTSPLAAAAAPAEAGEAPDPPPEIVALTPTPETFPPRTEARIDEWMDVHAQYAMKRLSQRPTVGPRVWSRIIPAAVKRRTLEGIYIENQGVPALRARGAGGNWWEILPKGDAVACYKVPADQRPILVMDDKVVSNPAILDRALVVAFQECGFGWLTVRAKGSVCSIVREPRADLVILGGTMECSGDRADDCLYVTVLPPGPYEHHVTCDGKSQTRTVTVPGDNQVHEEVFDFGSSGGS